MPSPLRTDAASRSAMKLALLLVTFVGFNATFVLAAGHRRHAPELDQFEPGSTVDVIVQYAHTPTERHHSKVLGRGGRLHASLELVNSAHYTIPAGAVQALADDPEVVYISPNRTVRASADTAAPLIGADVALRNGYLGSGVGIAILDSGIDFHNDLSKSSSGLLAKGNRIVYQENFVPGDTDTGDYYGHGTHVSGVAAGNGWWSLKMGKDYRGIATGANLINLRVLDKNGAGTDATVIAAINRAIALKSQYNIRVINLSLGRPVFESYKLDPLCQAVEAAWKAGIVVVVAAGNAGRDNSLGTSGYLTIMAPGNDPYVITVGATKMAGNPSQETIASYSSKGPTAVDYVVKPDLVAPGNQEVSLLAGHSLLRRNTRQTPYQF